MGLWQNSRRPVICASQIYRISGVICVRRTRPNNSASITRIVPGRLSHCQPRAYLLTQTLDLEGALNSFGSHRAFSASGGRADVEMLISTSAFGSCSLKSLLPLLNPFNGNSLKTVCSTVRSEDGQQDNPIRQFLCFRNEAVALSPMQEECDSKCIPVLLKSTELVMAFACDTAVRFSS